MRIKNKINISVFVYIAIIFFVSSILYFAGQVDDRELKNYYRQFEQVVQEVHRDSNGNYIAKTDKGANVTIEFTSDCSENDKEGCIKNMVGQKILVGVR